MNREEIIQNLRWCANGPECSECSVGFGRGCMDNLIRMAADMLEADGADMKITESVAGEIAKLNEKLDAILRGDQPQKSADEMFRELGYAGEILPDGMNWYENKKEETIISWKNGYFQEITFYGTPTNFSSEEILACAQAIREMDGTP